MHLDSVSLRTQEYPVADHYPFNQPILRQTSQIDFNAPVTFFVGENGAGKSTLLEAVSRRCGIHMWRSPEGTRYESNPYEESLHHFIDLDWTNGPVPGSFFGSDTFRHFTRSLDEWAAADSGMLAYFGGESLVTKSHGQSTLAYFSSRYQIRGLYLLDEPETALSPRNQLGLARILMSMARAGHAQFIVATHSPILLACPGARILSFDHAPVTQISYEETDYYRLYKDFMDDPAGTILKERI